jgi:hypothetical protein
VAEGQREGDLWVYAACVAIGLWLLSAPPTFSYMTSAAGWSELIAGLLAVILSLAGLAPGGAWAIQP